MATGRGISIDFSNIARPVLLQYMIVELISLVRASTQGYAELRKDQGNTTIACILMLWSHEPATL